jgi:hypothetical protein
MQQLNFNRESTQLQEKMQREHCTPKDIVEAVDELRRKRTSRHLLIG